MSKVGSSFTRLFSGMLVLWLLSPVSALAAETAVTVNCNAGGSINAALANANSDDSLVITISGTCAEAVTIARDNVTLQGATPADGISAPASGTGFMLVMAQNGTARNVTIQSMTLDTGARVGLVCGTGSSVLLSAVTVNAGEGGAVLAFGNSQCRVADSALVGPGGATASVGVYATTGAYVELISTTVEGFYVGLLEQSNATALVGAFFGSATLRDNSFGVVLEAGASAQLSAALIEDNALDGVVVNPTGSFTVAGPGTSLTVRNNGGHGISLRQNSSAVIRSGSLTIEGNGGSTVSCEANVGLVLSNVVAANLDGAPSGCG